jgi:hypothetical protein
MEYVLTIMVSPMRHPSMEPTKAAAYMPPHLSTLELMSCFWIHSFKNRSLWTIVRRSDTMVHAIMKTIMIHHILANSRTFEDDS